MKVLLSIFITFTIISCGNEGSTKKKEHLKNSVEQQTEDPLVTPETSEGQYLAKLFPINLEVSGPVDGAVTLSLEGDELIGDVRFFGNALTAETAFEQTIHLADRCPNLADDLNQDGVIDEEEALLVVGDTLIPLDADLNSQWLGANIHPLSDSFGSYYYSQLASYQKFLDDLWEDDINLEDQLVKIEKGTEPDFRGKVAIIRGISKNAELPSTMKFSNKRGLHSSFPLLCGVFEKVTTPPGRRNTDRYPYPHIGDNPDDNSTIRIPQDDTSPDYDIEPPGPVLDYGNQLLRAREAGLEEFKDGVLSLLVPL